MRASNIGGLTLIEELLKRGMVTAEEPFLIPCADCGGRGKHRSTAIGHAYRWPPDPIAALINAGEGGADGDKQEA